MTQEKSVFAEASAPPAEDWKGKGAHLKDKVTQSAKHARDSVKETARDAGEQAKQMGREAAEELRAHSQDFAETRKGELGQRIKGSGESIRRVAEKLRAEEDPHIARYADALADRVVRAGDYVQSKDFRTMRRDLESVARKRPELVFGGMFLAGLAIARFLKASSPGYSSAGGYHQTIESGPEVYSPVEEHQEGELGCCGTPEDVVTPGTPTPAI